MSTQHVAWSLDQSTCYTTSLSRLQEEDGNEVRPKRINRFYTAPLLHTTFISRRRANIVEDGLPKWEKKRDRKENDFQFFFYGLKRMIRTSID
jgi:hypothetical protein